MKRLVVAAVFLTVFIGTAILTAAIVGASSANPEEQAPFQIGGRLVEQGTRLPLAGKVIASQILESGGASATSVQVGADGDFVFRELSDGPVTLIGVAEGHGREVLVTTVDARNIQEVEIALPIAITVRGRVLSASGQPAAGARLTVNYEDRLGKRVQRESAGPGPLVFYEGTWEGSRVDYSAGPGAFILRNIDPSRRFEIVAEHPALGTGTYRPMQGQLEAGKQITEAEIVLR